jgi:hypothetical protein
MSKLEEAQAKLRERSQAPAASTAISYSSPAPIPATPSPLFSAADERACTASDHSPPPQRSAVQPHGRFSSTAALIEFFNRQSARIRAEAMDARHGPAPPIPHRI